MYLSFYEVPTLKHAKTVLTSGRKTEKAEMVNKAVSTLVDRAVNILLLLCEHSGQSQYSLLISF